MSADDARPYLMTESGSTVPVDEYLSGELPDGWSVSINEHAEPIIRSPNTELFIRVTFDGECPITIQLCKGPDRDQSERIIQEGRSFKHLACAGAAGWAHVIAATISEITDE